MHGPPYRIVRPLGRGGMAEVHLAEAADGTRVALKRVLPEHAGDARFRRMFLDEVRIASTLSHPGIVRVLASGELDGRPFIALECVDGLDAHTWCARADELGVALPEVAALRIAADVARALHAAHEARDGDESLGIVHRDVTPGNVLIARDGRVLLGDFGIAKARDRLERTSVGTTKGKLAFMAPEQMLGGEIDRRADVFSLGCTLHRLLTGRSAISGEDDAATLMAGADLALAPELADDVREVLARALRPSRVRRWPTAQAMADAIEAILASRGTDGVAELRAFLDRIDVAEEPAAAPVRARSPRRGVAVAASILGLSVAAAAIAWGLSSAPAPTRAASPQRPSTADAPALAERATSPDGGVVQVPTAVAPAAVPPVDAGAVQEPLAEAPHAGARSRPSRVVQRAEPPSPDVPADPVRTGFLAVAGPGAVRHVVYVDGQRRDFAPLTLELPVREHLVELRDAQGVAVAERRVDVREDHTRRSPLRWIVPASGE